MDAPELRRRANEIVWWHDNLDLGHGVKTKGYDRTAHKLKTLGMPKDLTGQSVLDVGAKDGFFSFEAERRGGRRVMAVDKPSWNHPGTGRRGFDFAREALDSKVEDLEMIAEELSPETIGTFDLVLFLGVLYHVKNPMLALERVASVTGNRLIMETATDLLEVKRPAAAFYPAGELGGDASNWWAPNLSGGVGMLKAVGFREVKIHYASPLYNRIGRTIYRKSRRSGGLRVGLQQGRAVFHAFK